jgi:hypothetical protein
LSNHPRSASEVLAETYDPATQTLKTSTTSVTIDSVSLDVNLDASGGDSVKISDGAHSLAVNSDGSINVNSTFSGTLAVDISAASGDSIKISDGTNTLGVNADGSLNLAFQPKGFSTINVSSAITVTTSSTQLLAANSARLYAHIVNNSGNTCYLQYGGAAVLNRGIKLNPNAMLTVSGFDLYLGQINAISASTVQLDVLEGV